MAALAAGRSGARTLLVERFGSLGGTGTAAMMSLFYVPYAAARGLIRELFDRLIAQGGAIPGEFVVYDAEMYKVTALNMLAEARVQVVLHTLVSDVIMDGKTLRGIIVENKSGRQAILSRVTIDASGDADLAARGAYLVDLHDVGAGAQVLGSRVSGAGVTLRRIERAYGVPFRCLIPVGVDGVIVAGRAISAIHEGAGSVRGQAVCMTTGHAAGTAAALACRANLQPRQLDVTMVQETLQAQRAILFYPDSRVSRSVKVASTS
jgi:hypothetical protein